MTINRANPIGQYEKLPRWRCKACKYEMECAAKGRNRVMTATASYRKFKMRHKVKKPNCPGEFIYLLGTKKPEE